MVPGKGGVSERGSEGGGQGSGGGGAEFIPLLTSLGGRIVTAQVCSKA